MYKLMLVDDEPEIREGLQEVVDLRALGFEVVGEAANGVEGVRLAETLRPDLIITDIRMPLMDGLAMAAEIKKLLPTTHFIMLSGYDEFEYARQAIELMALRYLLKPISSAEFIQILKQVKRRMDEDFEKRRDLSMLRQHFETSLPQLREMLLRSLLSGNIDAEEALEVAARYRMDISSPAYTVAFVRLPTGHINGRVRIDDQELLSFAIKNIVGEVLAERLPHYLFHYDGMLAVLILLPGTDRQAFARTMDALDVLRQNTEHYLNWKTQIGVGALCASLTALPGCARQALSALNFTNTLEDSQVLSITDVLPASNTALSMDEYTLRVLGNSLKLGDAAQAEASVCSLLEICRQRELSPSEYRAYLLEILMVFIRTSRDVSLQIPDTVQQDVIDQLMLCPPLPKAAPLLQALCGHVARLITENRASSTRQLARQAVAYLQQNYMRADLTIEKVCNHLHISTSYFSALMKKEVHKTFLQYITELRMDRAMTLLVSSELKTAEIARQVGIGDPSYFSYAFKKHFGVSPSQARRSAEGAS